MSAERDRALLESLGWALAAAPRAPKLFHLFNRQHASACRRVSLYGFRGEYDPVDRDPHRRDCASCRSRLELARSAQGLGLLARPAGDERDRIALDRDAAPELETVHAEHPWESPDHPHYLPPARRTRRTWPPVPAQLPADPAEGRYWRSLPKS